MGNKTKRAVGAREPDVVEAAEQAGVRTMTAEAPTYKPWVTRIDKVGGISMP